MNQKRESPFDRVLPFFIRLRSKPWALPVDECVDYVRIIHGRKYCCYGGFR